MHVLATTSALLGFLGFMNINSTNATHLDDHSSSWPTTESTEDFRNLFIDPQLLEAPLASKNPNAQNRKRVLVTGGAGFVGSHLVDSLMWDGHQVTVLDNFYTGRKANIEHWLTKADFKLIESDVIDGLTFSHYDQIYHLASPASPVHYMRDPIKTIETITLGSLKMLDLARISSARIVLASTSEIYGDPLEHPQSETYWGNTNPIGPRSCYDESKRLSESLAVAYRDQHNVSVGIARIFNTYGPRMQAKDGRVMSNFITQMIGNKPITIYGTGEQTRSFQYISDLVRGLKQLMNSNITSPINLGNPDEISITTLATTINKTLGNSTSEFVNCRLPTDDPKRRRPDIRKAKKLLDWEPKINLAQGLSATIEYFTRTLER